MVFAVDTCSLIAFGDERSGKDVELVSQCLTNYKIVIPPVVVVEMISSPTITPAMRRLMQDINVLTISENYWLRAGELRALLVRHRCKCKLGDVLIAQSCIDHGVPLITRDKDFKHFVKHGGLKLAC